ncbi:helix-turn-helix domain-containing protein, partial [Dactylosporangium maewongense]|uniref:helix-turn-helix domain-containing protein n=1 Tax=Dactylosporangium maewongense TaxID=634393 RepID=UPI003CD0820D
MPGVPQHRNAVAAAASRWLRCGRSSDSFRGYSGLQAGEETELRRSRAGEADRPPRRIGVCLCVTARFTIQAVIVWAVSGTVKRAFKYRFYPTPGQAAELARTFGCVRLVYNLALQARTEAWTLRQERVNYHATSA